MGKLNPHTPRIGDKVWDQSRVELGEKEDLILNPNGYIDAVIRQGSKPVEVRVTFHDKKFNRHTYKFYDVDTLDGKYRNETMGYMLYTSEREDD